MREKHTGKDRKKLQILIKFLNENSGNKNNGSRHGKERVEGYLPIIVFQVSNN